MDLFNFFMPYNTHSLWDSHTSFTVLCTQKRKFIAAPLGSSGARIEPEEKGQRGENTFWKESTPCNMPLWIGDSVIVCVCRGCVWAAKFWGLDAQRMAIPWDNPKQICLPHCVGHRGFNPWDDQTSPSYGYYRGVRLWLDADLKWFKVIWDQNLEF